MMSASPVLICWAPRATARKSGAAHLVHAPGGRLDGNAGGDGGLPRRVLPLASGQHLTHDHFIDIGRLDVRPLQRRADGDLAERMRRHA